MSSAPVPPASPESGPSARLASSLRTAHRSTLGLIAACAIVSALQDARVDAMAPRAFTYAAIGLAVVTVACRRMSTSPVLGMRARAVYAAVALTAASALGLTAAALAVTQGAKQTALVFVLAAALLILRPPVVAPSSTSAAGTRES